MDSIRAKIHLDKVPHFTTIHTFIQRMRSSTFTRLVNRLGKMFYDQGERIPRTAIDSFGFISSYASHSYSRRTDKMRTRFLKTSVSGDTNQQIITGLKIFRHPVHDSIHAKTLLKQCHRTRLSDLSVMDNAYHSGESHTLVWDTLKARKFRQQVREIKINVILYNLAKLIPSLRALCSLRNFPEN